MQEISNILGTIRNRFEMIRLMNDFEHFDIESFANDFTGNWSIKIFKHFKYDFFSNDLKNERF